VEVKSVLADAKLLHAHLVLRDRPVAGVARLSLTGSARDTREIVYGRRPSASFPPPAGGRPRKGRALETIERNARAQTRLIDDLLDMARIVSERIQLDVRPVELVSVVNAALESLRPAIDNQGLRMGTTLDPTAGPVWGTPSASSRSCGTS
jgi:signal transduction histidine kinase